MRILLVNKYNYLRSGAERYLYDLKQLLETHGHQVAVFAMQHPRNQPSVYDQYFVPFIDFRNLTLAGRLQAALRVIWFPQAARQIARMLDDFQPDVVHLCNIYHQLSPAILKPISQRRIPILQTLHDYKLICPNYLLYTDNRPCMRCQNGRYFQAVRHRCAHNSLSWSALAALEMTLHKRWQIYERHVARFIAPSLFLKRTVESFGIAADQVDHLPNFIFPEHFSPSPMTGKYIVYAGRLAYEKGLPLLIRAMSRLPQAKLLIVGEGPQRPELEQLVQERGLTNICFTGYLQGEALKQTLAQAFFTVVPSAYYEVFPYAVLEAMAMGKAVVAARIGGIPEQIDENVDGLLFTPGREEALAACLTRLWNNPVETQMMGTNGRHKVMSQYTPARYYAQLLPLYETCSVEGISSL
jgi:glycosyltransferase involved in cell wall biosynthesis